MAADSVDDLHYAEDLMGGADLLAGYCRPTCGSWPYGEDCGSGDDCGCPCHEAGR